MLWLLIIFFDKIKADPTLVSKKRSSDDVTNIKKSSKRKGESQESDDDDNEDDYSKVNARAGQGKTDIMV